MSNIAKARRFISHWEERDLDSIVGQVAEYIFYHNIPMEPVRGRNALKEFIAPLLAGAEKIEWQIHQIAETSGGAVLTERTDTFFMKTGDNICVRVMGVFEFNTVGEISQWRDYFDLAEFRS